MRRHLARFFFVVLLGGLAMVLGIVTSVTLTPPGRDLLARVVSEGLDRVVRGDVRIGGISGSFLYDLTFEDLVIRDTAGVLLASVPRLRVGYRIPNLAARRIVFGRVEMDNPVIQIIKRRNGRLNYQEIFGLGEGPGGGASPLVVLNDVHINSGLIRVSVPWNPPRAAVTERQRDSALAAQRDLPGRIIQTSAGGLERIYLFEQVTARFPEVRISTPDRQPFQIEMDSLATRVNDPGVQIRDAKGRLRLPSDSLVFSLDRGALPNTVFAGGGVVSWPQDTVLFDFQLVVPRLDLDDLRWISPEFPAMLGSVRVTARSLPGGDTEYALRGLDVADGPQAIDGDLVAITSPTRGFGVRDLDLRLEQLDLDAVRGYLDTLPFRGTITGSLAADGFFTGAMDVRLDWDYADAEVPGMPVSQIAGQGRLRFPEEAGLTFERFDVRRSDLALGTVERIAPAVELQGRLQAVGTLTGALQDATFDGVLRHVPGGNLPVSVAEGSFHVDTRGEVLGLDVDATLDPLSLGGLRPSYPALPALGELRGRLALSGTLDRLQVDADLTGGFGRLAMQGGVRANAPVFGADSLAMDFTNLDLAQLAERAPATDLTGTLFLSGMWDTTAAPDGVARLSLANGRLREFEFDSAYAEVAVRDSVIVVDTALVEFAEGRLEGGGSLGWAWPATGEMRFALRADSLGAFDSLATVLTGMPSDTTDTGTPLAGSAEGDLVLSGSLDDIVAQLDLLVRDPAFRQYRTADLALTLEYFGGAEPVLAGSVRTDSVAVGTRRFRDASFAAIGRPDSLLWGAGVTVGDLSRFTAEGEYQRVGELTYLRVDSLRARLASHLWELEEPTTITLGVEPPDFTPIAVSATDGSGRISVTGDFPGTTEPGSLTVQASGLALQDVFALLQRDTSEVSGDVALDATVTGTAGAPLIEAVATVADGAIGDARLPLMRTEVAYADRRLEAHLGLLRAGDTVMVVDAELPIDLSFTAEGERRLPGPILVRGRADMADLAIIEAFTPAVDSVQGSLNADVRIAGTWAEPRLEGFADVVNGAMTVTGLGVRWNTVRGGLQLDGDSLMLQNVYLASNGGGMNVGGHVRLADLTQPILNLTAEARNFHAINVPQFLDLTATGNITLRGPVYGATLRGRMTADRGVLFFADLLNKNIIDLDDPANIGLIDTTLSRSRLLESAFQSRFLDSLRIADLEVQIEDDFWLRSTDANIQLAGEVVVDKLRNEYLVSGTLNALRGTYTLWIGPVARDFNVERGTLTYFGTPDLNAALDIRAVHTVRTAGEPIPIVAIITGTLLQPRLELTSQGEYAALPEVDLVSYLIFGLPSSEAQLLGRGGQLATAASYFTSAFSAELERALITDLGLPVDLIEIRPAITGGGVRTGAEVTQLVLGWQLGSRAFVTVNAGVCGREFGAFGTENVGASFQLRFSQEWRGQFGIEPTFQRCALQGIGGSVDERAPYQIGTDLRWEREF